MKLWLVGIFAVHAAVAQTCAITTVAGRANNAPAFPAPAVRFAPDSGAAMAVLPTGQLVFVWHNGVLRLDPPLVSSWTTTPPSTGYGLYDTITALLPESDTSILVIDGQVVQRLHPDGTTDAVAGNGTNGFTGDGGPAKSAELSYPSSLAFAADGSLLIGDGGNFRIRQIDANGNIHTIAGVGGGDPTIGDGGPAVRARIGVPAALASTADGSIYFLEAPAIASYQASMRLRVISPEGILHTLSPPPLTSPGALGHAPDGTLLIGDLNGIHSLDRAGAFHTLRNGGGNAFAFAPDGSIYIGQQTGIVERAPDGTEHLAVGNVLTAPLTGVPATDVALSPTGIATGLDGHLYVMDTANSALLRLRDDGTLEQAALQPHAGYSAIQFFSFDPLGRIIFISGGTIFRTELDGSQTTLAGGNSSVFYQGRFAVASDGSVYAAEVRKSVIHHISPDGQITVLQPPASPSPVMTGYGFYNSDALWLRTDGTLLLDNGGSILQIFSDGSYQTFFPQGGSTDLFEDHGVYLLNSAGISVIEPGGDYAVLSLGLTPSLPYSSPIGTQFAPDGHGNVYLTYANQVQMLSGYASCSNTVTPQLSSSFIQNLGFAVTPGLPVTLRGINLGPSQQVVTRPDATGFLPTTAGGVQVSVNGIPAPILSAQSNSLQVQIPYGMLNQNTSPGSSGAVVSVTYKGSTAAPLGLNLVPYSPSLVLSGAPLQGYYYNVVTNVLVRNADGSQNSASNPARYNSVVAIYFYGVGELDPPRQTGEYPTIPVRQAAVDVRVMCYGFFEPITWAGEVPSQPGLYQVNFQTTCPQPILVVGANQISFMLFEQ